MAANAGGPFRFNIGDRVAFYADISHRITSDPLIVSGRHLGEDDLIYYTLEYAPGSSRPPNVPHDEHSEDELTPWTPETRFGSIDPTNRPVIANNDKFMRGEIVVKPRLHSASKPVNEMSKLKIYGGPYLFDGKKYYEAHDVNYPQYIHIHRANDLISFADAKAPEKAAKLRKKLDNLPALRKLTRNILNSRRRHNRATAKVKTNAFVGSTATARGNTYVPAALPTNVRDLIVEFATGNKASNAALRHRYKTYSKGKAIGSIIELE